MSGAASDWVYALVVFADATDLWWLRLLRPGFRHCFVALRYGDGWVVVDPMSHYTAIASFPLPADFDLIGWYQQHGLVVVPVKKNTPDKRVAPFMPHSCVETVKRILGIREFWIVTPWQLFRHLNETRKFVLTEDVS
jgi:hypothetical protein